MVTTVDHRFAAVSPTLVETAVGANEIYHICAVRSGAAATGRRVECYLKTAHEIPFHQRLLLARAGPVADDAREPRAVAADLHALVSDLPIVVGGGPDAVAAVTALLRSPTGDIYDLQELFELFHPTAGTGDSRAIATALGHLPEGETANRSSADWCAIAYQQLL